MALAISTANFTGGLTPASYPVPLEIWRVTVRRKEAGRLGLEFITFGFYDTGVQPIAEDWERRIHTSGLGVVFSPPVVSENGAVFVVQMRFDRSMTLAPASAIVLQWEDTISNTEVVEVARVSTTQATGLPAEQAIATEIAKQEADKAKRDEENDLFKQLRDSLKKAGTVVTIVAVAAGVIALAYLASVARKAATS